MRGHRLGLALVAACGHSHATIDASSQGDSSDAAAAMPALQSTAQLCKLLNNLNVSDPTPNNVQFRSNLLGADLGNTVDVGGRLYVFFGDSVGYAGIWGAGESHPEAVGYATDPSAMVEVDPSLLCHDLAIISLPPAQSIGPTVNPAVTADFAGAAMIAPSGGSLATYIHDPAGGNGGMTFPNLPGDFEVPSGEFTYDGVIYIFYTTVVSTSDKTMAGAYLARWDTPSTTTPLAYQILGTIDERFDSAGPLGGEYINIAAETANGYAYLFGTGAYRASAVYLARMPLAALASGTIGPLERYDAATMQWGTSGSFAPVIAAPGYGETSVRYYPALNRWIFFAEEQLAGQNRIVARFADRPEGPWSDALIVHDMADPGFRAASCCSPDDNCTGSEFMNCDRTGFYGSYLFPQVATHPDGTFTVTYTLSSFDPYDVALFEATFAP